MDKQIMRYLLSIVCLTFCLHLSQAHPFSSYAKDCSYCNSTASANCDESQGVLCSCRSLYVGDGLNCTRMALCDSLQCCPDGYNWDVKTKQCVDIDECTDPALNKCSPTDTCVNKNGIHLCSTNRNAACGAAGKCSADQDCLKINGDVQCADPCDNYNTIDGTNRLHTLASPGRFETDRHYFGWYRYVGKGTGLKEGCVGPLKCGSYQPYSIVGKHPAIGEGIVIVPLLSNTLSECVVESSIQVKTCPGGFYTYKIAGQQGYEVYCTDAVVPT